MTRQQALVSLAKGFRVTTIKDKQGHYKMGESGRIGYHSNDPCHKTIAAETGLFETSGYELYKSIETVKLHLWASKRGGYISNKLYSKDGYEVSNGKLVKGCSDSDFTKFLSENVMLDSSITMQLEVEVGNEEE